MKFTLLQCLLICFVTCLHKEAQNVQKLLKQIKELNNTVIKQKEIIGLYEKELNGKTLKNDKLSNSLNVTIKNHTNSSESVIVTKDGKEIKVNITKLNHTETKNNNLKSLSPIGNTIDNSGYVSPAPSSLSEYALYSQLQFDLFREKQLREEVDSKLSSIESLETNFSTLYQNFISKYHPTIKTLQDKYNMLNQNTKELSQIINELKQKQLQSEVTFNISNSLTNRIALCSSKESCDDCLSAANCVWCYDEQTCYDGDMYGPFDIKCKNGYEYNKCPDNTDIKKFLNNNS